jgi:hypothetical protein
MPWLVWPNKDVNSAEEAMIRRCPNRVTALYENAMTPPLGGGGTWGTEISKYPEEKKSNEIPLVSDERTGNSPNPAFMRGVVGPQHWTISN